VRVATHDGSFHADEVFAIAALELLGEPVEVVRTRDRELLSSADLRVDVGFSDDADAGDFDHHQRGFEAVRDNGVRYASFGLVWRRFGEQVCGDADVARAVDDVLVAPVDAQDVGQQVTASLIEGVRPMTVSGVVAGYNARWDESLSADEERACFDAAVAFARGVLQREIASAAAGRRAVAVVRDGIAGAADPRVVVLAENVPFKQVVVTEAPEALFVVYPKRQGFGVEAVPRELGTFANRRDLPEAWAGLEGEALQAVSGVQDAVFCHVKRFLAVARSREGALELARLALQD
jgi:uncharacterized UPF0160 family protein